MYLEPVNLLHLVFFFLALFGLLLVQNSSRFASLKLLLALQMALLLFNFLEETGITGPHYLISPIFTLAFGPALFVFVRQLTHGKLLPHRRVALHLMPMLLALPFGAWPQLIIVFGSISQAIYLAVSARMVRYYHRAAYATRSDAPQLRLDWLTSLLVIFVAMMLQDLVRLNLQPFAPLPLLQGWYLLNTTIYFLLTAYLVLKAVHSPQLYAGISAAREMQIDLSPAPSRSDDMDPEAAVIFKQLDAHIREKALFKKPRLGLRDLASLSGLQEKTISWAINQGAATNLSDYINGLRVEAVCLALDRRESSGNLLDIAMAMGFSSKSTFNGAFKKATGLTPSQYQKR